MEYRMVAVKEISMSSPVCSLLNATPSFHLSHRRPTRPLEWEDQPRVVEELSIWDEHHLTKSVQMSRYLINLLNNHSLASPSAYLSCLCAGLVTEPISYSCLDEYYRVVIGCMVTPRTLCLCTSATPHLLGMLWYLKSCSPFVMQGSRFWRY